MYLICHNIFDNITEFRIILFPHFQPFCTDTKCMKTSCCQGIFSVVIFGKAETGYIVAVKWLTGLYRRPYNMYTYLCLCVWVFAGSKVLAEKWVFARMLLFYGLIWHYRMLSSIGCYSNRSCLKTFMIKSIFIFNTLGASNMI